jgi:hypothetical protein
MDRLPWAAFHTRLVIALGVAWVLDGLEITIASNVGTTGSAAGSRTYWLGSLLATSATFLLLHLGGPLDPDWAWRLGFVVGPVLDDTAGQAQASEFGQGRVTVGHEGLSGRRRDVAIHTEPKALTYSQDHFSRVAPYLTSVVSTPSRRGPGGRAG